MNAASASLAEPHEAHWITRSAFQVVSVFFFSTQAALGYAVYREWYWLAGVLILLTAHFMHGILIGFHEASHGMLRKNRFINELEGIVIGAFSFVSLTLFRVVHQTHHAHLASERDQEMWPLVQTRIPRWLRCIAAFLELNAGLIFTPLIFLRAFLTPNSAIRSKRVRRRIWAELSFTVALWTGIFWAVHHWNVWTYFLWVFFAPAWLAANLQSWRKYIEHVGMMGTTVNSATRNIVAEDWLGRAIALTLLHEPFHGVHHQSAGVPHSELPQRVSVLLPRTPEDLPPFPSYGHALIDLVRSLANPRAGAQWRANV